MITSSALLLLGLGFSAAVILSVASRLLYVKEDPRIRDIEMVLPGANCGGCGLPGCTAAAKAIVEGKAPADVCIAGGMDTNRMVAEVMGLKAEYKEPQIATVRCIGGKRADKLYLYEGAQDCRAQARLYEGSKQCTFGCLGLGSCVKVCPFEAIHMGPDNLPVVNPNRCKGCGRCADVCPRGVISIVSMTARLLHFNEESDCLAPCVQRCPAQINVPLYIRKIREGDLTGALLTIKERNPFPLACGRVCLHLCENICRRNIADHGVAINRLQRYLGEWEMNSGTRIPITCAPDTGHKVAVVGGGPAGLSCAYFLRRLGHHPVIFEAMPKLGGMLRYGIPEYRMPNEILDWEIEGILKLGIKTKMGVKLGEDFNLKSLEDEGFKAFFLGIGAWTVPPLGISGEDAKGVIGNVDFLTSVGIEFKTLAGQRLVIIGESNTAMDCSRSSIRLGAKSVTVICPCIKKDMSANKRDVDRAMEEGVQFLFLTEHTRVISNESGSVTHVEYIRLELEETGKPGKRKAVAIPNSETLIDADMVIAAIDRKPDLSCLRDNEKKIIFEITKENNLAADKDTMQTSVKNVFTAGDLHTGRAWVVMAVGGGRRAARSIHYYLTQGSIPVPENLQSKIIPESILKDVKVTDNIPRVQISEVPAEMRIQSFTEEVKGSISGEKAKLEACRCLYCGLVCYDQEKELVKPIYAGFRNNR